MFRTILLCLDGSEGSKRAVPVAVALAEHERAQLVLAHVEEKLAAKGGPDLHADEDEIQAAIRAQAEELAEVGIKTTVRMATVMPGGPAHALARIAEEVGAELIVVGTRGQSPVAGLLLGGVTQRLLHISHRPVLAVPPPARDSASPEPAEKAA